MAGNKKW